jgi:hypothetical protein
MKDFLKRELKVGDEVVFIDSFGTAHRKRYFLQSGTIIKINDSMLKIQADKQVKNKWPQFVVKVNEANNEWKTFPENTPPANGEYIVYAINITGRNKLDEDVFVAKYFCGDWLFENWEDNKVTHWMDFPDAPSDKKGEE